MSLRARILLLVLLAMLPLVAVLVYVQFQDRNERIAEAKRELAVLTRLATHELAARLRAASQLAFGLAQARQIDPRDPAHCSAHLAEIYRRFPEFISITVFLPNGDLRCTSLRVWKQANVADRAYFKRTLASNEVQYETLVSRVSGASVALVAYAARDAAGSVKFVLTMGVDLQKFAADSARISQYHDRVITIWADDGTLLARFPEGEDQKLSGQKYPESDLYRFVRDNPSGASGEVEGLEGVTRVYALAVLPKVHGKELRFAMGVSRAELTAKADRYLRYALLFSGVLLALAVASVWLFAERGIRRPVTRVLGTINRLADGDLEARTGRPYPRGEIGHLMEVVDTTVDTLQRQRRDLDELTAGLERRVVERTEQLHRLQREQERVLNTVDCGIHGLDRDGKIFFENPVAAAMFGRDAREMIGQPAHATIHHSRADGTPYPQSDCPIYATLRDGNTRRIRDEVFWRKDGTSFPVAYTSTPLHDDNGNIAGVLVTFRDVTSEREVERMKNEFIATVSHELRTPLASLLGFSELMLTRTLPEEKNREFLGVIHKESKRLNTLISDFLDLQRIESGRVSYSIEPLNVAELVREVALLFSNHGQHPLTLDLAEGLPQSLGDHDRIKQVLQNLLSNAVKFSPQGGEIVIAAYATGDGKVEVSITDRGLGIPEAALPKLFSKFYRVDSSDRREIGGTGLGLALCKEIITAHDGRIWAESTPGQGSTFRFTLPVKPAETWETAAVPAAAIKPSTGYVLVVENDATFATLIREHLATEGLTARIEPTAEGALDAARAAAPMLVVLDIHLAGKMDGWDLLSAMKTDYRLAEVPVIITTITDKRHRGLALGASDYLVKPFPMEMLIKDMRRFLPEPKGKHVLIVDDDESFRAAVASAARLDLGCAVEEAENGREALAIIRERIPDLVILDLMMPKLDGFAVLDTLRTRTETATLPVLVVTGKDLTPQDKEHLREGIARVLTKAEYSHPKLQVLVRNLLARREMS